MRVLISYLTILLLGWPAMSLAQSPEPASSSRRTRSWAKNGRGGTIRGRRRCARRHPGEHCCSAESKSAVLADSGNGMGTRSSGWRHNHYREQAQNRARRRRAHLYGTLAACTERWQTAIAYDCDPNFGSSHAYALQLLSSGFKEALRVGKLHADAKHRLQFLRAHQFGPAR